MDGWYERCGGSYINEGIDHAQDKVDEEAAAEKAETDAIAKENAEIAAAIVKKEQEKDQRIIDAKQTWQRIHIRQQTS